MRVLVTNDDGVTAPGIAALARAVAAAGHELLVVAPSSGHSGAAAAIGDLAPAEPIGLRPGSIDGLADDVRVVGVDGPPGLCVILACMGAFGPPPDVVASGVNAGLNTGRSILHSGTIGAALTAANHGLSGVAVSASGMEPAHFGTAAELAARSLDELAALPAGSVVNLNVPDLPAAELRGVRSAVPATFGEWRADLVEVGEDKLVLGLARSERELDAESDTALAAEGFATITLVQGPRAVDPDLAAGLAQRLGG